MKMAIACLASLAVAAGLATQASAALIPLVNPSFEADKAFVDPAQGWIKTGVHNFVGGSGFNVRPYEAPADGSYHIVLGPGDATTNSYTQVLTAGDVGGTVTLDVAIGNRSGYTTLASNNVISILLDGTVAASAVLSANPALGTWTNLSATYTVQAGDVGKALGVRISHAGTGTWDNNRVEADNVRLDLTAIPEPTSLALLGVAGLAMIRRRRTA